MYALDPHSTIFCIKVFPIWYLYQIGYLSSTGVVILDTEQYYEKLDKIIGDPTKFQEIDVKQSKIDPIISNEKGFTPVLNNPLTTL